MKSNSLMLASPQGSWSRFYLTSPLEKACYIIGSLQSSPLEEVDVIADSLQFLKRMPSNFSCPLTTVRLSSWTLFSVALCLVALVGPRELVGLVWHSWTLSTRLMSLRMNLWLWFGWLERWDHSLALQLHRVAIVSHCFRMVCTTCQPFFGFQLGVSMSLHGVTNKPFFHAPIGSSKTTSSTCHI